MRDTYFAAVNSGGGFVSYYPELFCAERFGRLYLIKGGPGTGKSALMRCAAEAAERRGERVVRFLCSADPDSLDAIIVGENRFAMVDATAPHLLDPRLPGAADELLDLGQFWACERLAGQRAEICAHSAEKARGYSQVYGWLSGAAALLRVREGLLAPCLDLAKMRRAAMRYLRGAVPGTGRVQPALVESFGMRGRVTLDSLHTASARAYVLTDTRGAEGCFLAEVARICRERKIDTMQSFSPLDPHILHAVYLPQTGVAFLHADFAGPIRACDKTVNLARFRDPAEFRRVRPALRKAEAAQALLLDGARQAFAQVAQAHFALEQIYTDAMDFAALDRWRSAWLRSVFAES